MRRFNYILTGLCLLSCAFYSFLISLFITLPKVAEVVFAVIGIFSSVLIGGLFPLEDEDKD